jgi:hypothetical protein
VSPIEFDVAVFTNLSEDHLDFHLNMERYFLEKQKLFYHCRRAIVNVDDNYGSGRDDHFLPFCGNIAWEKLMPVLSEINFPGVLDLELTPLKEKEISKVIGDKTERLAQESAINRVHKLAGKNKPFIVSCGYDDFYVRCTDLFTEKCRYMGIPHFVLLTPGKHSWQYWGFALEQHIHFFQTLLRGENLGY